MKRPGLLACSLIIMLAIPLSVQAQDKQTIRFKITKDGLVTRDIQMEGKRFAVPKGVRLKLLFEYADTNGNAHQFAALSAHTEVVGTRMTPEGSKSSTLEFTVGEHGEHFYRISCELPCLAMEELTDYVLFVDRTQ